MADLSDVEAAILQIIEGFIYPDGADRPSITGAFTKVFRGWPIPTQLEEDLRNGEVNVSVFPQDTESKTTRYQQDWQALTQPANGLILTVSGTTITLSGTVTPGNVGAVINGKPYVYQVQPTDSLQSIAAGLSGLIDRDTPSSVNGATVTIPNAYRIETRAGGIGTIIRELRRQKRGFQVTVWCSTPDQRDITASAIDSALAAIDYIPLPDGTDGRLLYERSHVEDRSQEENLYRRDLFYSVEYGTTQTQTATEIVVVDVELEDWNGNPIPPKPITPIITPPQSRTLTSDAGDRITTDDGNTLTLD